MVQLEQQELLELPELQEMVSRARQVQRVILELLGERATQD